MSAAALVTPASLLVARDESGPFADCGDAAVAVRMLAQDYCQPEPSTERARMHRAIQEDRLLNRGFITWIRRLPIPTPRRGKFNAQLARALATRS
jgi:hypothetical protein